MATVSQTQCLTLRSPAVAAPVSQPTPDVKPALASGATVGKTPRPPMQIVWFNAIGFLVLHLIAVYGLVVAFTEAKFFTTLWAVMVSFVSGLGVTIGAHRMYTHRAFKAKWGVRLAFVTLHTIAGQNCLYIWVRDHRQHHKYSDTDADPHNATRGFFFSHIGWLMVRKHPDVIRLGKTIDLSDLEADPIVMFQKRHYKTLYTIFSLMMPVFTPCLLWHENLWASAMVCFFMRTILVLNITWLVNSWAHLYGTRPYNNHIEPVESKFVSFFSMGEGWHNYHHSFPWDYRAAELGMKYDLSTRIIEAMARRGWVYDLKEASATAVRKRAALLGDGSHPVCHEAPAKTPPPPSPPSPQPRHFVQALPPAKEPGLSIA